MIPAQSLLHRNTDHPHWLRFWNRQLGQCACVFCCGRLWYASRIALVEERALAEQFGQEFQDYKKHTWALIPFIW